MLATDQQIGLRDLGNLREKRQADRGSSPIGELGSDTGRVRSIRVLSRDRRGGLAMPLGLAARSRLIAPSATLAMGAEARRLKARGVEVLDFALGEPDFDTPANIQEAAFKAIRAGQTHYTPPAGIPELRQAVAAHYTQHHRPADRSRPGRHLQRGEALDPQCAHGRLRAGRRGDHPRSVLGELCRPGQADRRDAGRDLHDRGRWLQADARPVPGAPSRPGPSC